MKLLSLEKKAASRSFEAGITRVVTASKRCVYSELQPRRARSAKLWQKKKRDVEAAGPSRPLDEGGDGELRELCSTTSGLHAHPSHGAGTRACTHGDAQRQDTADLPRGSHGQAETQETHNLVRLSGARVSPQQVPRHMSVQKGRQIKPLSQPPARGLFLASAFYSIS